MKYVKIQAQLLYVSLILLATFAVMMALVERYNIRWDFTQEKIYSLAEPTAKLLSKMEGGRIEVFAFYPTEDPARPNFELFLKESKMHHHDFHYDFYDPNRAPTLAKQFQVKELYTVILRYDSRQERLTGPTEQTFTNALFRLAYPKIVDLCFVTGHGEASLNREDRASYRVFRQTLEQNNYRVNEIILLRDQVPPACRVLVVAGPHNDMEASELRLLKQILQEGGSVFFLIDPMDSGTGKSYAHFMREFGIILGEDVVVDKMSKMVGGDFLVPLVSQYITEHPITEEFNLPTFYPVARSVQPSTDAPEDSEVVPLAVTGSGSWAERNLGTLEKGQAAFDPESDIAGPIPVAIAYEKKVKGAVEPPAAKTLEEHEKKEKGREGEVELRRSSGDLTVLGGRMVVVGDSDFLNNAYVHLSGNENFALNAIRWLARDDRSIALKLRYPEFKPLLLNVSQRNLVVGMSAVAIPLLLLIAGTMRLVLRRRHS